MPARQKDKWDKTVAAAQIFALLFVPIAAAGIPVWWQYQAAEQQVSRDYVQIAVNILSTRPISKNDPLRGWAIQIINQNSPVALTIEQRKALNMAEYAMRPSDMSGVHWVRDDGIYYVPAGDRAPVWKRPEPKPPEPKK